MIKKSLGIFILFYFISILEVSSSEKDIYKKIDLFGEVLEKINQEYVDEIETLHLLLLVLLDQVDVH